MAGRHRVFFLAALAALAAGPTGAAERTAPKCPLRRVADPVVLRGSDLPTLRGIRPAELAAFAFVGGWRQIPVQVDERAVVDYADVYHGVLGKGASFPTLVYADAGTFTGADPDPALDADDEVVFLARDAGEKPPQWRDPPGVSAGSGVQVEIDDPLAGGGKGYVYLFRSAGGLDPAAGKAYVRYEFRLKAGDYRKVYKLRRGPNPENSLVSTPFYTRHFSDRWINDGLTIERPRGTGVNLLDMHKNLFMPGVPVRSVKTFAAGEGAFIVNKSGPVRAIRSCIGCNSGPLTQREHLFYEQCEDLRTTLRVHAIIGLVDFFDYSPAAKGMTYFNNLNEKGVKVDGVQDEIAPGRLTWEMLRGEQGALIIVHELDTNLPGLNPASYYLDDEKPKILQCTGDAFAYASSGPWFRQFLGNTDPRSKPCGKFIGRRVLFFEGNSASVDLAKQRLAEVTQPLTVRVTPIGRDD